MKTPVSPIFHLFSRLSTLISLSVDLQSWQWPEDRRAGWKVATPEWQSFSKKWRVDSNSSIDRNLSVLDFAPLTSEQLGIHLLEVIYVRESYVNMFERIWSRALTPPGTKGGVLVTGQPGTGMSSMTSCHSIL